MPGDYVMISVSDTGPGMAPDVVERAFEPFFTTKKSGKGSGLGLSMVQGFVKQSEGHINVYSEVGRGTTVSMYLPRTRSGREKPAVSRDPTGPHGGGEESILVVEDQEEVRESAVALLKELGYRVVAAEDGPTALKSLENGQTVDLLFTDVVMPGGLDGVALADRIRKRVPDIKVLFTSGFTQNTILPDGIFGEKAAWIAKPYREAELAERVRNLLDRP